MALSNPRYGMQISWRNQLGENKTRTINYINLAENDPTSDTADESPDEFNSSIVQTYAQALVALMGGTYQSAKIVTYRTIE